MLHCPTLSLGHFKRALLVCVAFSSGTTAALAADPTGDWLVADGVAKIRVAECNGSMWGAVSWEKMPGGKDENNPDAGKQSRPTLAMPILLDMKKEPSGDKWKGLVYNAKDGKSYESTISPIGADKLKIQGCVLGFLCGGETWSRASGPISLSPTNAAKSAKAATPAVGPKQPAAAPRAIGQKAAAPGPGQVADIGDICLIPEIASPPPTR